jgi:hypothetical protein
MKLKQSKPIEAGIISFKNLKYRLISKKKKEEYDN